MTAHTHKRANTWRNGCLAVCLATCATGCSGLSQLFGTESQTDKTLAAEQARLAEQRNKDANDQAMIAAGQTDGIQHAIHEAHQGQIAFTHEFVGLDELQEGDLISAYTIDQGLWYRIFLSDTMHNQFDADFPMAGAAELWGEWVVSIDGEERARHGREYSEAQAKIYTQWRSSVFIPGVFEWQPIVEDDGLSLAYHLALFDAHESLEPGVHQLEVEFAAFDPKHPEQRKTLATGALELTVTEGARDYVYGSSDFFGLEGVKSPGVWDGAAAAISRGTSSQVRACNVRASGHSWRDKRENGEVVLRSAQLECGFVVDGESCGAAYFDVFEPFDGRQYTGAVSFTQVSEPRPILCSQL